MTSVLERQATRQQDAGASPPPGPKPASRVASAITTAVCVIAVLLAFLIVVGPLFLPYRLTTTSTGSMEPTIPKGSLVVDRKVPSASLRAGQIITFNVPGEHRTVTHRIHYIFQVNGAPFFRTKGDANASEDAWRIPASGDGYRVWFHIPYVGKVTDVTRSLHAASALVAAVIVLVVASAFVRQALPRSRQT